MTTTDTHRTEASCIDETARTAGGSLQWLLEKEHAARTHLITPNNGLEVLMCGEDSFGRIAADIEAAQGSIDIICWGFDPGMELRRSGSTWPRGQPYGSLLHAAAARGVKVRLLVWHEPGIASAKQNNLPGYTGDQRAGYLVQRTTTTAEDMARGGGFGLSPAAFGAKDLRTPEQLRNDYCVQWWREVMAAPRGDSGASTSTIEVKMRRGTPPAVQRSLADEMDQPSAAAGQYADLANEKGLIQDHSTHHQKTVLIDYGWDGGSKAVGYVMGLNSVTDYWDTAEHVFDDPRREPDWARVSKTAQTLPEERLVSRDPYHDYVCRTVGPALRGVHKNFVDAWKRAGGAARTDDADELPPRLAMVPTNYRAQIVRTQPEEGDKTIKSTYFHAPTQARNYIYIENQYFFYESWVRNLKDARKAFMAGAQSCGKDLSGSKMLHLFVVIPWPENDGMVPRTYDTVKSLGEGSSFTQQDAAMTQQAKTRQEWSDYQAESNRIIQRHQAAGTNPNYELSMLPRPKERIENDPVYDTAAKVEVPKKNHTTGELEGLGLKVLIARLTTFNRGKPLPAPAKNTRQVYIHSKLMVIDDAFFTLGSANLNQRSMAADSEINIASDDHAQAMALRQMVWRQHAGGYLKSGGGTGQIAEIAAAFKDWQKVMRGNQSAVRTNADSLGYLVPFEDDREIHYRLG